MARHPPPPPEPPSIQWLARALDHVDEGLQVLSPDWRYLYVNAAVCQQGGRRREELLGKTVTESFPGFERTAAFALLEDCMHERRQGRMDNEFERPDGTKGWYELRVQPVFEGLAVFSVDISARKRLEAELRHAQRLEALGRLAGSVAHDFNNVLTVIESLGSLVHSSMSPHDPARRDMEHLLEASDRAAALVRQLLDFSRKRPVEPKDIDVNELVRRLEPVLRRLVGREVELSLALPERIGKVRMDRGALEQVLINLVVNARDALQELARDDAPRDAGATGSIRIETQELDLDHEPCPLEGVTVASGRHVLLSVSDTGVGMDEETKRRLFEPFFTTKPAGEGTGLGLATCHGIVRQAGGSIAVVAEPGRGATFQVYLPLARAG